MDAPVFVILREDGTPKTGYNLLTLGTNEKSGKSYFIPNGEGTPGQIFAFGVKVDADLLPQGVNTHIGLKTDEGVIVPIRRTPGKTDAHKRLATDTFTHGGEAWHVSPGQSVVHQLGDGTLNLRLNVVRGEAGSFGGGNKRAPLKVETVQV